MHNSTGRPIKLTYFAILAEQAGLMEEVRSTTADTYGQLYQELMEQYQFSLPLENIKVAVNGEFVNMHQSISAGDQIVFIPPVAGG